MNELTPTLAKLQKIVAVEINVGERLDLETILRASFLHRVLLIVVCGPPGMADAVRSLIAGLSKKVMWWRRFEFVDKAYRWGWDLLISIFHTQISVA